MEESVTICVEVQDTQRAKPSERALLSRLAQLVAAASYRTDTARPLPVRDPLMAHTQGCVAHYWAQSNG